jgi:hypothetical protein
MEVLYGDCHCGCGEKTNIVKGTVFRLGLIKGEPRSFIKGHVNSGISSMKGDKNPNWHGGRMKTGENGEYVAMYTPDHVRARYNHVMEHILIAESVLGKPLPPKAVVHHVDHKPANNQNNNLIICENQAYHNLLHRRETALHECGHADYRKCWICHNYDDPTIMKIVESTWSAHHIKCMSQYRKERYQIRRRRSHGF